MPPTNGIQQGQSGGNAVTSKRATIAYNALGQRTTLARFQSTGTTNAVATTDYTYDTINRLSGLIHKQGSTTLAGYTYSYDALSRPTSINSVLDGVSTFTHHSTSQLTAADHSSQVDESYGFDANCNRNTSGYTTATNNRTTAAPGFTFTYDDEGNRTSKTETATGKVTEYTWDYRNRSTTVRDRNTSGGAVVKKVDYQYDAFNRLVRRTFVTNHRKYDSFRKLVSESNGAVDLIFGFTGKQLDEATGLQHNLFRWYDSALGQWLSEDPIGFAAGDENVRRYVGNRSITMVDPDGLQWVWVMTWQQQWVPQTRRLMVQVNYLGVYVWVEREVTTWVPIRVQVPHLVWVDPLGPSVLPQGPQVGPWVPQGPQGPHVSPPNQPQPCLGCPNPPLQPYSQPNSPVRPLRPEELDHLKRYGSTAP